MSDEEDEEDETEDEEDEQDEAIPEWVKVSKNRFDAIRSNVNEGARMKTKVDNKEITLDNAKK